MIYCSICIMQVNFNVMRSTNSRFTYLLYLLVVWPSWQAAVRVMSVPLLVCFAWVTNLKTKWRRKTKIGVTVPWDSNFQLKRVKRWGQCCACAVQSLHIGGQPHNMSSRGRHFVRRFYHSSETFFGGGHSTSTIQGALTNWVIWPSLLSALRELFHWHAWHCVCVQDPTRLQTRRYLTLYRLTPLVTNIFFIFCPVLT